MRLIVVVLLSVSLSIGCAAGMKLDREDNRLAPRGADCAIHIFEVDEDPGPGYSNAGHIYFHDTGFSTACSRDIIMERMREEACGVGADAANLYKESFPNALTTCYRVKAHLLKKSD